MKKLLYLLLFIGINSSLTAAPSDDEAEEDKTLSEVRILSGVSPSPAARAELERLKREVKDAASEVETGARLAGAVQVIAAEQYYEGGKDAMGMAAVRRAARATIALEGSCRGTEKGLSGVREELSGLKAKVGAAASEIERLNGEAASFSETVTEHAAAISAMQVGFQELRARLEGEGRTVANREELVRLEAVFEEFKRGVPSGEAFGVLQGTVGALNVQVNGLSNENRELRGLIKDSNPFKAMVNYCLDLVGWVLLHEDFDGLTKGNIYVLLFVAGACMTLDTYGIDAVATVLAPFPVLGRVDNHKNILRAATKAITLAICLALLHKGARQVALSANGTVSLLANKLLGRVDRPAVEGMV